MDILAIHENSTTVSMFGQDITLTEGQNTTPWTHPTVCTFAHLCAPTIWRATQLTISSLIILINVLHLIILHRMKLVSGFSFVVKNMAVTDIGIGIMHFVLGFCEVQKLMADYKYTALLPIRITVNALNYLSFVLIITGLFDRFLSVCYPTSLKAAKITSRWKIVVACVWSFNFIFSTATTLPIYDSFCVTGLTFPDAMREASLNKLPTYATFGLWLVILTLGGIMLFKIRNVLKKHANSDRKATRQQRDIRSSLKFLRNVAISYICLTVPFIVVRIVGNSVDELKRAEYTYAGMQIIIFASITNTFIYGWNNDRYIAEVKSMFGCTKASTPNTSKQTASTSV